MFGAEDLTPDLREVEGGIDWSQAQVAQELLVGSLFAVAAALRDGSQREFLVGASYATAFSALQQRWMGLPDALWDRGRPERDKSFQMWLTVLGQGEGGALRAVEALEAERVHLEGGIAERDLVSVFEAHGRLLSILGATVTANDSEHAFGSLVDDALAVIGRMGAGGR